MRVPVVAVLHGVCFGAALQIALATCIRVAHPDAKFSVKEIAHGLVPDMAITSTARHLVRKDALSLLTYTGESIDADSALRFGLVTLVEQDALDKGMQLADRIAANAPAAIMAAKKLIRDG